jgi:hypothetical protein
LRSRACAAEYGTNGRPAAGACPCGVPSGGSEPCTDFLGCDRHERDLDWLPVNGHAGFRVGGSTSIAAMDLVPGGKRYLDSIFEIAYDALRQL